MTLIFADGCGRISPLRQRLLLQLYRLQFAQLVAAFVSTTCGRSLAGRYFLREAKDG